MAFKNASRVHETVSNLPNAVTAFNLSGAVTSGRTFVAGIGTTNTCMYCAQAVDGTGAREAAWEIGVGTITSGAPDTLTRTQIIESSNADAAVDFSTSTKIEIFTVDAASMLDSSGGVFNALQAGIYHYPQYPEAALLAKFTSGNTNQLYWPLNIVKPIIVTAMACDVMVAGSAGHRLRMGLHECEDATPTTLRFEAGTVLTDTVAFKEITGLSHFLPPGKYFLTLQTELNVAQILGVGGGVSEGMWTGFGVKSSQRDFHEGVISELGNAGQFGTAMWDAGTKNGLVREPFFAGLLMYKFSEV